MVESWASHDGGRTMVTSAYMPDVKVEIAFNSGYNTPIASRTWTDVSSYVELAQGINITRGRQDEFANCDPNKLTLTLDNRDGRFTAGKTGGAYYPNVKIGRPIRVTSTPVGGAASVRFLGYVDEWPVEWNGTDSYAFAKISASSRMARLGFNAELRSIVEEEFLVDNPNVYYTLSEPEGSTSAANTSSATQPTMTQAGDGVAVTFAAATGVGTDGLSAPVFAPDGKCLKTPGNVTVGVAGAWYLECFFNLSTSGTKSILAGTSDASLNVSFAGILQGGSCSSPASVADGLTHHAALVYSGTSQVLYLDGVAVDSAVVAAGTAPTAGSVYAGNFAGLTTVGTNYTVSHVAAGEAITAARILAHAATKTATTTTETASAAITRLAAYADIPAAEVSGDAGTNPVNFIDPTGKSVVEVMRAVEETESGVLFDARDNTLTFHGRARRYTAATAFTLDVALQEVEAGIAPKLDRSALVNDVTATASDGSTSRAANETSIGDYGYARETIDIASTQDIAYQTAAWRVATHGEPVARISSLGVDVLPLSQVRQDSIFTLDVSSRIALSNLPTQAPATSLSFFIEGYTESIGASGDGAQFYNLDFNVSPTTGYDVWTIEDAVYGQYDAYPLAL